MDWLTHVLTRPKPAEPLFSPSGVSAREPRNLPAIGITYDTYLDEDALAVLSAEFPDYAFAPAGVSWGAAAAGRFATLITAAGPDDLNIAIELLQTRPAGQQVIVVLKGADMEKTRLLFGHGAADVLPYPASETSIALSLERVLRQQSAPKAAAPVRSGEVIAFLNAGGGAGSTSLCVQAGARLGAQSPDRVAIADLDIQFGMVGLYLDMPSAVTLTDIFSAGAGLAETPFAEALSRHASGARLMASPTSMMGLDSITPVQADALVHGLRRDFALTLIDLPNSWTAWTHRVLSQADRIVLVAQLTLPRIQAARRQLATLAAQGLERKPVLLVCNALSPDQPDRLPIKWAEKSLGREFDLMIPEDRKAMEAAANEGFVVSKKTHGSKLEKALAELAATLGAPVTAQVQPQRTR
ncbi:MAG: hypothetical protein ABWZ40_03475 [Caulobacterales bacterium]